MRRSFNLEDKYVLMFMYNRETKENYLWYCKGDKSLRSPNERCTRFLKEKRDSLNRRKKDNKELHPIEALVETYPDEKQWEAFVALSTNDALERDIARYMFQQSINLINKSKVYKSAFEKRMSKKELDSLSADTFPSVRDAINDFKREENRRKAIEVMENKTKEKETKNKVKLSNGNEHNLRKMAKEVNNNLGNIFEGLQEEEIATYYENQNTRIDKNYCLDIENQILTFTSPDGRNKYTIKGWTSFCQERL